MIDVKKEYGNVDSFAAKFYCTLFTILYLLLKSSNAFDYIIADFYNLQIAFIFKIS